MHGPIMRHALRDLIRHFNYFNFFNSEASPIGGLAIYKKLNQLKKLK